MGLLVLDWIGILGFLDVLEGMGLALDSAGLRAWRDVVANALHAPRISAGLKYGIHESWSM